MGREGHRLRRGQRDGAGTKSNTLRNILGISRVRLPYTYRRGGGFQGAHRSAYHLRVFRNVMYGAR